MKIRNVFKKRQYRAEDGEVFTLDSPRAAEIFGDIGVGGRRVAGQKVNSTTAERVAAVFACQTALAESVAMLPSTLVETAEDGTKTLQRDHSLYKLLKDSPNGYMDSFEFFELMLRQTVAGGDHFSFKEKNRAGEIISMRPLLPESMVVKPDGNKLRYKHTENGIAHEYTNDEIFHLKAYSKDGVRGRSPIGVAADTVGFSLALLEHGNKLFDAGGMVNGFIQTTKVFKDNEQRRGFLDVIRSALRKNPINLLEQGTTFVPGQMNNRDAQFLEAKQFSVIEIARIFRLPPVMIQVMDKGMAFASVEQLAIMFIQYSIQPWITRIERAMKRQLLNGADEEDLHIKFNVDALLRGDMLARTTSLVQQLQYGLMTINEGRALENRNPIPEAIGNKALLSHNLRPVDEPYQGSPVAAPVATTPAPEAKPEKPKTQDVEDDSGDAEFNGAEFAPLFRSVLGRYVKRSREKAPDDIAKLINEPVQAALETVFRVRKKADPERRAAIATNVFASMWKEELSKPTRKAETEAAEIERRINELLFVCGATPGESKPGKVINVRTPQAAAVHRVKWVHGANGEREVVITQEREQACG